MKLPAGKFGLLVLGGLGISLAAAVGSTLRIMPVGDSNTEAPSGTPGGYRLMEYSLLTSAGHTVDFVGLRTTNPAPGLGSEINHEGSPGISINGISEVLNAKLNLYKPDYIQLMIGTNDVNQTLPGVETPEGAASRLDALINQITLQSPDAILLVASIPPFFAGRAALNGDFYWATYGAPYNAAIPGIVSRYADMGRNVRFVDVYAALTYAADFKDGDGVHMLQSGYDKIGVIFANAIVAVPEPSVTKLFLITGGAALLLVLARRRWRRLRAKA